MAALECRWPPHSGRCPSQSLRLTSCCGGRLRRKVLKHSAAASFQQIDDSAPSRSENVTDLGTSAQPTFPGSALEPYNKTKDVLLRRTQFTGLFLVVYLYMAASTQAAVCLAAGACGGWLYLSQIASDIEHITAENEPPLTAAKAVKNQPLRALAMAFAAYRQAIKPRLLIPVTLFAGFTSYRELFEHRLGLTEAGAMLAGFLCFKGALLLALWDDNKPTFGMGKNARHQRPRLQQFEEIEDVWRPRRER